ncbi:MAG: hypothetical protein WC785_05580 [Tatlockia sp.]|jgi:hypothetical protein
MEKNQERTLAYHLAKEINPNELDKVSGGGGDFCLHPTFEVSGNSSSMDTRLDMTMDW